MNEKELQKLILEALHLCGITAWMSHKVGAYKHRPIIEGISDIIGPPRLAIEVKLPGKIPNPKKRQLTKTELAQIEFIDIVNQAGGIGFFADSLEMVVERLNLPLKL